MPTTTLQVSKTPRTLYYKSISSEDLYSKYRSSLTALHFLQISTRMAISYASKFSRRTTVMRWYNKWTIYFTSTPQRLFPSVNVGFNQ